MNATIFCVSCSIMTLSLIQPRFTLCLWRIQSLRVEGVSPVPSGISRMMLPLLLTSTHPSALVTFILLIRLHSVV